MGKLSSGPDPPTTLIGWFVSGPGPGLVPRQPAGEMRLEYHGAVTQRLDRNKISGEKACVSCSPLTSRMEVEPLVV